MVTVTSADPRHPPGTTPAGRIRRRAQPAWKSSGRLADGREIIYFDEAPGLRRAEVPDPRVLRPVESQAAGLPDGDEQHGLRRDPLTGEWVVVAAARQDRTFLPPADHCPLCPSRPGSLTEVPADDYDVVVFENRFPALAGAPGGTPDEADGAAAGAGADGLAGDPLTARRAAYGRCEVVCFTADHQRSFAGLTPRRVRTVVEAWADRSAELGAMPGIRQVYCFENRGQEIGVTLHHPHGQIYALPFVAPHTARVLATARAYDGTGHRNIFDDLVAMELSEKRRIVVRNEQWAAFVPPAARWPYEVMLFPARRVADLPSLDDAARDGFCVLYLDVLRRLDALFGVPMPYIAAWNQAPVAAGPARDRFGLHLRLMPAMRAAGRLKYLAGTESGMSVWVTDVTPEDAAARLRAAG
jgi:UDPglucose--hexose-1-phosphate uridylyltransferase